MRPEQPRGAQALLIASLWHKRTGEQALPPSPELLMSNSYWLPFLMKERAQTARKLHEELRCLTWYFSIVIFCAPALIGDENVVNRSPREAWRKVKSTSVNIRVNAPYSPWSRSTCTKGHQRDQIQKAQRQDGFLMGELFAGIEGHLWSLSL